MGKRYRSLSKILEYMWFGIILVCLFIIGRELYLQNWRDAIMWVLMLAIAVIMFWVRRGRRIQLEKED